MWVQLVIWVVMMLIQYLLTPKQKSPTAGEVSGVPNISDEAPIPVVFGTHDIQTPNLVWYGDVATSPIRISSSKK